MRTIFLIMVMTFIYPSYLCGEEGGGGGDRRERPALIGGVAISDMKAPPPDAQSTGRAQVDKWSEQLGKIVSASGKGDLPPMGENGSDYLAVLYLYCTSKQGPCPFILDTILEADTVGAQRTGDVACPTMNRFWKTWSVNSYEERTKFLTSLTDGLALAEFNDKSRSRYLLCKSTVKSILEDKRALAAKYGEQGSARKPVDLFVEYLKGIKDANTDIFTVTR